MRARRRPPCHTAATTETIEETVIMTGEIAIMTAVITTGETMIGVSATGEIMIGGGATAVIATTRAPPARFS